MYLNQGGYPISHEIKGNFAHILANSLKILFSATFKKYLFLECLGDLSLICSNQVGVTHYCDFIKQSFLHFLILINPFTDFVEIWHKYAPDFLSSLFYRV